MRGTRRTGNGCTAGLLAVTALVVLVLAACGSGSGSAGNGGTTKGPPAGEITLYTSYNQPEVDAVLAAYKKAQPKVTVKVFRAPTGQISARIAAEQRSGGVRGDVMLLSDPLSMQQFGAQGLLLTWAPPDVSVVPPEARGKNFWGVTTSDVVVVHKPGLQVTSWRDLAKPELKGAVVLPNPDFAGSAFGALGYFALDPAYGIDYYRALKANGAVQVAAPGDVVTGVAQGQYKAGMALDFTARAAIAAGSPIEISAPDPGAIRLYAPMAVFKNTKNPAAAKSFANFLLTKPAQESLAARDRHPIRSDVPPKAPAVKDVVPDWATVFGRQAQLRTEYHSVFHG